VRESFVKCMFVCRSLECNSIFQSANVDVLQTFRVFRSVSAATE
jgi:hypothetical protein